MTAVEGATVVGYGVAIVGTVGHAVSVAGQVEPVQGKCDGGAQFVPASLRGRESLQVDDKDLWKTIQSIALRAFPPCLAPFTCRHLIPVQNFFFCESVQAVKQRDFTTF